MTHRLLPMVLAACLLCLVATGVAAQAVPNGAATKPTADKDTERLKARKAAAIEQQRTGRVAPKPTAARTTGAPDAAASPRPAAPADESFHDCHSAESDA